MGGLCALAAKGVAGAEAAAGDGAGRALTRSLPATLQPAGSEWGCVLLRRPQNRRSPQEGTGGKTARGPVVPPLPAAGLDAPGLSRSPCQSLQGGGGGGGGVPARRSVLRSRGSGARRPGKPSCRPPGGANAAGLASKWVMLRDLQLRTSLLSSPASFFGYGCCRGWAWVCRGGGLFCSWPAPFPRSWA